MVWLCLALMPSIKGTRLLGIFCFVYIQNCVHCCCILFIRLRFRDCCKSLSHVKMTIIDLKLRFKILIFEIFMIYLIPLSFFLFIYLYRHSTTQFTMILKRSCSIITNTNFWIHITLQPDVVDLWYLKQHELCPKDNVWNIKMYVIRLQRSRYQKKEFVMIAQLLYLLHVTSTGWTTSHCDITLQIYLLKHFRVSLFEILKRKKGIPDTYKNMKVKILVEILYLTF